MTSWLPCDYIVTTLWLHSDYILTTFRLHSDYILATCCLHSDNILTTFWPHSDYMSMIDNQVHLLDLRNLFSIKSLNFYVKNVVYKINCYIHTCQWYRSFEIAHTVPQGICKITSKPKTNLICRAERDSCCANHFRFIFPSYWGGV